MTSPKNTPQKIQPVHTTSPVRPLLASALLIAGLAVGALSGMRGQPVTANPSPAVQIHSIDGKLMQPAAGGPLEGIVVTIVETGATTTVDSHGNFVFGSVGSGIYTLTAAGKGYASLKITDVVVTAGKTLTLPNEEMPVAAPGGVQTVSAISESELGIQTLASYYVVASAAKAFEGGRNMDIPRTSNDIQPYTIINQEAIEESNRLNLGDFLRDNLTQNATGLQYNQTPSLYTVAASGSSQVNLQGLGNLQTLILINGARVAAQVFKGVEFQPNINQIPLGAIDHIEVLPDGASAIYGSSAVGGVINIILKKNYSGGGIEASYQNSMVTDNPTRTMSLYDSFTFKNTSVNLFLNYSDGKGPIRQDRPFVTNNYFRALGNDPVLFYSAKAPYTAGALPNIALNTAVVNGYVNPSSTALTLKNGVSLGSTVTYIPAGTSLTTDAATLAAGLVANAGQQNFGIAPSVFRGSQEPLLNVPKSETFMATINHKFNDKIEAYVDFNLSQQKSTNTYLPLVNSAQSGGSNIFIPPLYLAVPGNAPTNPFQQNVFISLPLPANDATSFNTTTVSRSADFGLLLHLPKGWEGVALYSYNYTTEEVRYGLMNFGSSTSYGAQGSLLNNGLFNPFVDSLANDQNISKLYGTWTFYNPTYLEDFNARASGPLFALPGGSATLTVGFEARLDVEAANYETGFSPSLPGTNGAPNISDQPYAGGYQGEKQAVKAYYVEVKLPVISPKNKVPLVNDLEFQLAGRIEDFNVISAPDVIDYFPYRAVGSQVQHTAAPGRLWNKYTSANPTFGFKYKPANWLAIRGSYGSGFVPPTYAQLGGSSTGATGATTAPTFDPITGQTYSIAINNGTLPNPNLKPQTAKNWNLGAIFQPESGPLKDLRLSLDFYKSLEYNLIYLPTYAQALASPGLAFLVPRGSNGLVTSFSAIYVNAAKEYTDGYTMALDYRLRSTVGTFNLHAASTIVEHLKKPFVLNGPLVEYSGFADSGGVIKTKSNATLTWLSGKHWTLGWNTSLWDSYKQQGSPSDPEYNGAKTYTPITTQLLPQGGVSAVNGISIPAQIYHNVFVKYVFGNSPRFHHFLDWTTIQVGVNDVFNTAPPFDANSSLAPFFYSPYGNVLLRTYLLKIKKEF